MAPAKASQSSQLDDESLTLDDSSKDSQDGSQTLDMNKITELMARHKATVQARRRNVEKQLSESHKAGFESLKHHLAVLQTGYEKDLKFAQRPHLEKLAVLLQRKKQLESNIDRLCASLERSDASVNQQLGACIQNRVEALRG